MNRYVFTPPPRPSVAVFGTPAKFPVNRVYCIGRNYAEHIREMGKQPQLEEPIFFLKPADSVVTDGSPVVYPAETNNFQHEVELVVAIGREGHHIEADQALEYVFGYAVGNDFTRRDLQIRARERGWPWELGKSVDDATGVGPIHRAQEIGHLHDGRISLTVDSQLRQQADLSDMLWKVPLVIAGISRYYKLKAGDLIFTGTPAGVAALHPGDVVVACVEGLSSLTNSIIAGVKPHPPIVSSMPT